MSPTPSPRWGREFHPVPSLSSPPRPSPSVSSNTPVHSQVPCRLRVRGLRTGNSRPSSHDTTAPHDSGTFDDRRLKTSLYGPRLQREKEISNFYQVNEIGLLPTVGPCLWDPLVSRQSPSGVGWLGLERGGSSGWVRVLMEVRIEGVGSDFFLGIWES